MRFKPGDIVQITRDVLAAARDYGCRQCIKAHKGSVGVVEIIEDRDYQVRIRGRRSKSAARRGRPDPIAILAHHEIEPAGLLDRLLYEVASFK
jgi:hypothetical protein